MKTKIAFLIGFYFTITKNIFASGPGVVCNGLPGCKSSGVGQVDGTITDETFFGFIGNLISTSIQYVAVLSVLALVVAGIMYLVSSGEDEKVKKAKSAIIWSLVGVLVSTSAWAIINLLNSFKIN